MSSGVHPSAIVAPGARLARGVKPDESSVYYYVGIDRARFKKPVVPGDQLEIEVHLERTLRSISRFGCVARVAGETVAEATILCSMRAVEDA